MTIMQQIQDATTVSELRGLLYRAETGEETAAICLRETKILDAQQAAVDNDLAARFMERVPDEE